MPHQEVSLGNGRGLKPDAAVMAILLAVADTILAQRKHSRRAFA